MHEESHETGGDSRREFLKKAGTVAWVVPTMQIVNMASAGAQTNGSIVTTTSPPSTTMGTTTTTSTTTTSTTTTTKPPECSEYIMCRIKADWEQGWDWDSGVGANDCIQDGDWRRCDGREIGAQVSGDDRTATVTVPEGCEIMRAAHKAGQACLPASISNGGRTATFSANPQDISHVELVVKCCADDLVQR